MTSNSEVFNNDEVVSAVAMMACIVVIGGIGNMLVFIVQVLQMTAIWARWKRRRRWNEMAMDEPATEFGAIGDKTIDFFILVLAVSDLFVCLVIVPATISMEILSFRIQTDFLCKLYYVLFVTNTTFSSLLISAVALDRYIYICHSLKHILTLFRAKMLVFGLATFSLFIGAMAGCVVGVKLPHANLEPTNYTLGVFAVNGTAEYVCEETEHISNITAFQKSFAAIAKRVNHGSYFICIMIVTTLYGFVFWAIVSAQARRHRLVFISSGRESETPPRIGLVYTNSSQVDNDGEVIGVEPPDKNRKLSIKKLQRAKGLPRKALRRAHCTFQNFRSALMLFLIAIIYIVTFVPSLVIANGWIKQNLVLFYFYYVNSAANPCIYATFSKSFRQMVRQLFTICCSCCHESTSGLPLPPTQSLHWGHPSDDGGCGTGGDSKHRPGLPFRCPCLVKREDKSTAFPLVSREKRRQMVGLPVNGNSSTYVLSESAGV